jgi:hypothetical protein
MAPDPDNGFTSPLGPQPGINGMGFAARTNVVYYTCTARKLFMRMSVDPATHTPVGQPEVVAADITADDFCLDEYVGVAYLTPTPITPSFACRSAPAPKAPQPASWRETPSPNNSSDPQARPGGAVPQTTATSPT